MEKTQYGYITRCTRCGDLIMVQTNATRYCEFCKGAKSYFYSTRTWLERRDKVLVRDHHTCQACGGRANCVTHKLPTAKGGTDEETNLKASCRKCVDKKTMQTLST